MLLKLGFIFNSVAQYLVALHVFCSYYLLARMHRYGIFDRVPAPGTSWVQICVPYGYKGNQRVPKGKLKFKKYGYVWVRQGYVPVPYKYVFWVKQYKNPPKNHYLPYFSFNLSPHPPIRRQSYRTSNQKVLKTHTRKLKTTNSES